MEHGARLSTSRVMAIAFIFMSVLIVLSLSVNVIQGVNNYRLQNEQRTAVTPMAFNAPFAVSQNSADASYLQQMALSFIALRLNVSSETVDASHQALLRYIRPGAQNQMKVILAEEAKRIKNDNVNSAFFQTSVRVWPQYGRVEIRGVLKTWIGDSKPFTDIKHYILILKRENGVTWLDNFGETDDEKNNTAIIFGSLFFSCSVMAANGTLAPTVVPMVNGGQASIAISNTSPNLFTVPGDRIIAVNSLDGALTNNEQTASGGVVVASAGLYGDAHAGLDAKPSLFGVRVDVGAKVGGRASIDGSDLDSHEASSGSRVSHDARHDIDARASKDFKEASDYFTSRKVSESGSHTDNNADSRVDQLSAALNSAKQSYDQYTTNMTRSHEYAEMASRTESMSGQMSEDLSQQFAQYVMKHAPQDAEAILTNTSSPEIAERRRAMAWSFVQEQVQPGVDNAWRESRGDIGKGMESVPSGGGSQDIIADHQGHQAIIEQRTQDSNIRNDVKHQVDNMVTEYRGNIGDTQSSIHGEENIVGRQYSELQNHHKTEALSQNNKYDEERESQKIIPEPSGEAVKKMIDGKKERLKGPL